jgi:hypothetical protein
MKFLLDYLRKKSIFYSFLKKIYGWTIGFYWFKTFYLKKIGLWDGKKRIRLVDDETANKILSEEIKSKKPFMMCRYGSTEFRNLFSNNLDNLCKYSGFFPNDKKLLKKFREVYFEASKKIDYLCVWNYLNHFFKKISLMRKMENIKSFIGLGAVGGLKKSWMNSLKNKKVLVIHPFKKTIEMQMKKRKQLGILPKLKKLEVIPAVQTIAGNTDPRFKTWFDALDWMKKEIDKKDFDIALIGCGAYGLPLAAHVKKRGKQAIHMGGSLQLLFGITGKRWENNIHIKKNKYWVQPLSEDTPKDFKKVEGGCYW